MDRGNSGGRRRRSSAVRTVLATLLVGAAASCWVGAASAQVSGTASQLQVERRGGEIVVQARADVAADLATVWATLIDYDRLSEFIPGMAASRVLERSGDAAVVEQQGRAGIGPLRVRFTVRLAVEEERHRSISANGIGGDFGRLAARYELKPLGPARTSIVYQAQLAPALPLPPIVGLPVLRGTLQEQFDALLTEIQRRAGEVNI